jgi:hypothetical protein
MPHRRVVQCVHTLQLIKKQTRRISRGCDYLAFFGLGPLSGPDPQTRRKINYNLRSFRGNIQYSCSPDSLKQTNNIKKIDSWDANREAKISRITRITHYRTWLPAASGWAPARENPTAPSPGRRTSPSPTSRTRRNHRARWARQGGSRSPQNPAAS